MYKQSLFQGLRFLLVISTIFFVYLMIKHTVLFFYPFLIALMISLIINPIVTFFEIKLKLPRLLATAFVMVTTFVFFSSSLFILGTRLVQGTTYLAERIPAHFKVFVAVFQNIFSTKILPYYNKIVSLFKALDHSQQATINEQMQQLTANIASMGGSFLQSFLLKASSIVSHLPSSMTVIVIILLASFLITNDWYSIRETIKKTIPSFANIRSKRVLDHFKKALVGFLKAQLILIFITGCIVYISLLFLRIEHALTITLLVTGIDLLPYIGTGIIFIPWIVYLFMTASYPLAISLLIVYIFIVITRQVFEPKILSANIGLNPLSALLTLFIGLQLWGIVGMLIAPILLVILKAFQQAGINEELWRFIRGY